MLFYTHLLFGIFAGLLFFNYINKNFLLIPVIAFFSIFPDIDRCDSKIGKKAGIVSLIFNFVFGHRGIFHTFLFPLFFLVIYFIYNNNLLLAITLGYLSHLFLDSFSKEGIQVFPFLPYRISFGLKVGGIMEFFILLILIIANIALLFYIFHIFKL